MSVLEGTLAGDKRRGRWKLTIDDVKKQAIWQLKNKLGRRAIGNNSGVRDLPTGRALYDDDTADNAHN